jgi:hypothetical protein
MWRKIAARNELNKQLKLVERIDAIASFDAATVSALRKSLTTAELIGKASTPPKKSSAPTGLTNQAAFEQYRNMMTSQLKEKLLEPPDGLAFRLAMKFTTPWMARYSRRQKTIGGSYGRLADVLAQQALVARNIARHQPGPGQSKINARKKVWRRSTRHWATIWRDNLPGVRRATTIIPGAPRSMARVRACG